MEEPRVWERAMEEGRGEWVTVSVSSKLKARKKPAAPKARAEKSSAAKDKVKAAKAAEAAAATAKVKAKAAAADVKAKAATKAAAADVKAKAATKAAAALWVYTNDVYGTKEQVMVKIDHRNSYIKWLLDWDKKPRKPLPNFPEELRKATDAIKAERDEHERVLADFKRDGYAYVQVDIFNDDDPRANLPRDQYEVIPDDSDDEA